MNIKWEIQYWLLLDYAQVRLRTQVSRKEQTQKSDNHKVQRDKGKLVRSEPCKSVKPQKKARTGAWGVSISCWHATAVTHFPYSGWLLLYTMNQTVRYMQPQNNIIQRATLQFSYNYKKHTNTVKSMSNCVVSNSLSEDVYFL